MHNDVTARCVCGARPTYRLARGAQQRYRCAACANNYPFPEWQAELLPAFKRNEAEELYEHYRWLREQNPDLTPEQLGTLPRFEGFAVLEERYQRERRRRTA